MESGRKVFLFKFSTSQNILSKTDKYLNICVVILKNMLSKLNFLIHIYKVVKFQNIFYCLCSFSIG